MDDNLIIKLQDPISLAKAIIDISDGMEKLLNNGINRRALIVLLADSTKVTKTKIEAVLNGLESLKKDFCDLDKISK